MNYKQSKELLGKIKGAKRILVNCHRHPDPDSIGSALALKLVLEGMGKKVKVICPSVLNNDPIAPLKGFEGIEEEISYSEFDFGKYDVFACLDSSSWDQVSGDLKLPLPKIPIYVIDHHESNTGYGELNLVDKKSGSVGEMLFLIFEDWKINLNKSIAECLMVAILGDTGNFQFPGVGSKTFRIAGELIAKGVDKDALVYKMYRSSPLDLLRFYGVVFANIEINKSHKFVYSILEYKQFKHLDLPDSARNAAAVFIQQVEGTEFGAVGVGDKEGNIRFSIRSRNGIYDTSKLAVSLGGGGHIYASGCSIKGMGFKDAKELFLETAISFAKSYESVKSEH